MSTTSSPTGGPRRRRIPLRYLLLAVVAVVAVLVAAFGASALGGGGQNLSAKDRIKADPPPTLFSDAAVAPTGREVAAQAARAQRLMQAWWASHGHQRDDAAFTAWAERVLPAPPSAARRTAEVAAVAKIAPARTAAGVQAATWLEAYNPGRGQVEGHHRTWAVEDLGGPAVRLGDAAHEVQPEARARGRAALLGPAEAVEGDLAELGGEPRSGVADDQPQP